MLKQSMDLLELLRKRGMDGDLDFLREALRVLVDGIMDAEVSAQIGAEHGERNSERSTYRNGYRIGAGSLDNCCGSAPTQSAPAHTGAPPSSSNGPGRYPPGPATPAPPQLGLLLYVQGGGLPVCSKTGALGPPSANAAAHRPMVWASLPNAAADQPCVNSHNACHCSRSRGVGPR